MECVNCQLSLTTVGYTVTNVGLHKQLSSSYTTQRFTQYQIVFGMRSPANEALDIAVMNHLLNTGIFDTRKLVEITGSNSRAISRSWHRIMAPKKEVETSYDALRCCVIAFPPKRKINLKRKRDDNKKKDDDEDGVLLIEPVHS